MKSTPTDIRTDVKKDADAIVRVCSYHRRDFDLVVVRSRPHDMQSVQTSLQAAFETPPNAKLGIFDHLPVELSFMVLCHLDIRSFFHFRQLNRRARALSTGLHEYQLVSKHGLEGLRGLLRAGLARRACSLLHHSRPLPASHDGQVLNLCWFWRALVPLHR